MGVMDADRAAAPGALIYGLSGRTAQTCRPAATTSRPGAARRRDGEARDRCAAVGGARRSSRRTRRSAVAVAVKGVDCRNRAMPVPN
jgi:hypothetical protein